MTKILVIDDEELDRFTLCEMLRESGYEAEEAASVPEGLQILETGGFDLVITDIVMPEMDGTVFIEKAREKYPNLPIIALSGGGRTMTHDYMEMAGRVGANKVLSKPVTTDELVAEIKQVL